MKKRFGNILIGDEIGRGAFGAIYSGIDTVLNRKVAVKVLDSKLTKDEYTLSLFKQEAVNHGQMDHPNVVSVRYFDVDEGNYFIVFELVEGDSLKSILYKEGKLELKRTIKYIRHVLRGLRFAHSKNIIHLDVKPSNILITNTDTAKLTDFGISKLFGLELLNKYNKRYGTPIYSSPEQILGLSPDFRSDIYSVGITAFEMLTGVFPFSFNVDKKIDRKKLLNESEILYPKNIDKNIKGFIDAFLLKAIKRDVEARYQSVLEMLEVLDNINE